MARIWYSVMREGYEHSTRSAAIIEELIKKHTLLITGLNKSYFYLKKRFPNLVHEIQGPGFVYENSEINTFGTVKEFLKTFPEKSKKNIFHIFNLIKRFNPDLIISDFEPASHYFAYFLGIPIISIDNMSVLSKCKVDIKDEDMVDYLSALTVINLFNPKSDYQLITAIGDFQTKEKNVFLFPPILRKEILKIKSKKGDFVLVYQTSKTNKRLVEELLKIKEKFVFYGMNEDKKQGNIIFKRFSDKGFMKDLSNCKAIIMTGGFTTISEALYLKKPMLIIPAKNQFEQKFNGLLLEKMGVGDCQESVDKEKIKKFISNLNLYNKNLEKLKPWDNSKIIDKLEELIRELETRKKPIFDLTRKIELFFRPSKYEWTLTIIKPDAVEKGLIGEVIKRLEKHGINPVAMKMIKIKDKQARLFYGHLKN